MALLDINGLGHWDDEESKHDKPEPVTDFDQVREHVVLDNNVLEVFVLDDFAIVFFCDSS